jgi:hypothetical protein
MFTRLTITNLNDQWELSDGDTLVGLVNATEEDGFEATYMAATTGDRFEGEELGTYLDGIDAVGAILEKFKETPHCYDCQRAHGGFHEGPDGKHRCTPCSISISIS